jgi:hypothetical protein
MRETSALGLKRDSSLVCAGTFLKPSKTILDHVVTSATKQPTTTQSRVRTPVRRPEEHERQWWK